MEAIDCIIREQNLVYGVGSQKVFPELSAKDPELRIKLRKGSFQVEGPAGMCRLEHEETKSLIKCRLSDHQPRLDA